jgi:hypothetical protein
MRLSMRISTFMVARGEVMPGADKMVATTLRALAIILFIVLPHAGFAQTPAATQPGGGSQLLSAGELEALVSPIALYPDPLLSEIFMASTYPLEVIEAERWINNNKSLKGDQLKAAVDKQGWDDSVKSLTATPTVLDMMSQKLDWTQRLGDAVLAQQPDVMDAVQRLRAKADANNKLPSNNQQTIAKQQEDGKNVIVIAPTQPDTVYVPYYDPAVVYGAWQYPAYPPYYFPAPGYIAAGIVATGIAFGAGYALGRWATGGYRWGGGFNWGHANINVNRTVNINNVNVRNNSWTHNPAHRQGVRYTNVNVAQKYGGNRNVTSVQNRADFRGREGAGNRADVGNRGDRNLGGGAGNRPNAGNNAAGNRPGGGDRAAVNRTANNNALGNISSGRVANRDSSRGAASFAGGGVHGGGGMRSGGGGGGRGGGRRSDMRLKHDVALLGRLDNSIGLYRFVYDGGHTAYVGVMAQEVQAVVPQAVARGRDGYLLVFYDKLGLKFQSYDEWIASGAQVPVATPLAH